MTTELILVRVRFELLTEQGEVVPVGGVEPNPEVVAAAKQHGRHHRHRQLGHELGPEVSCGAVHAVVDLTKEHGAF